MMKRWHPDTAANKPGPRSKIARWRTEPDVILMLRVKADEPGAFAELVDIYWSRMFARFYKQLGDRQEAEDLAQDVFMRLYRNRRRYQPRARFSTWLYHIARNVARNAIRSRRRRPVVSLGQVFQPHAPEGECRVPESRNVVPSQPLEREETSRVVRSAMRGLGRRQRIALELQCQDRSYAEIAAELSLSPQAAKSLLYRARIHLRECLQSFMAVGPS